MKNLEHVYNDVPRKVFKNLMKTTTLRTRATIRTVSLSVLGFTNRVYRPIVRKMRLETGLSDGL